MARIVMTREGPFGPVVHNDQELQAVLERADRDGRTPVIIAPPLTSYGPRFATLDAIRADFEKRQRAILRGR